MPGARPAAIFFDVDFTLIHPGPTFQPEGYARFCARYGIHVDASQFADAVKHASEVLSQGDEADLSYDPEIFIEFTRVLTRAMGARGRDVALSSSEHGFMKPHPSIFEAARGAAHRHARGACGAIGSRPGDPGRRGCDPIAAGIAGAGRHHVCLTTQSAN